MAQAPVDIDLVDFKRVVETSKLTQPQIAEIFDISISTVKRLMQKHNITRSKEYQEHLSEKKNALLASNRPQRVVSQDQLRLDYEINGKTIEQISADENIPTYELWGLKKAGNWLRKNLNWKSNKPQVKKPIQNNYSHQNSKPATINHDYHPNNNFIPSDGPSVIPLGVCGNFNPPEQKPKPKSPYDKKVDLFKQFIGWKEPAFEVKTDGDLDAENKAWLVATDWHIPYHDEVKMKKCIADFKEVHKDYKFHGLVIGGDYMDGYHLNSYGIDDRPSMFKDELTAGKIVLEWLSSLFDEIIVLDDNHIDGRYRKAMLKVDVQLHFLSQHPYDYLVEGIPNTRRATETYKNGVPLGWFTVVGDAFIGHAETHGAQPMKPSCNLSAWVDNWEHDLGLGKIRVVMEAHVHKGGEYVLPGKDRKLIETGCLVSGKGVSYSMQADIKYKPVVNGCVYLIQKNGRTDFNKTRFIHIE